jgi:hypothetical protein
MNAVRKGDMLPCPPADIDLVWIAKGAIVPVSRSDAQYDALVFLDRYAADRDVVSGYPEYRVHDREVANQLIGYLVRGGWIRLERAERGGVLQQADDAERDLVRCGLVTSEQQEKHHADQLLVIEGVRLLVIDNQSANKVIAWRVLLDADEFVEVLAQVLRRVVHIRRSGGAADQLPRAGLEELPVTVGDAEQFAYHHAGHGQREFPHYVGGRPGDEQRVD